MISVAVEVLSLFESAMAAGFNATLAANCAAAGISPQAFTINWTPGQSYFRAGYTLQWLREVATHGLWPTVCMFIGTETDDHDQFPCNFKGPVTVEAAVFLRTEGAAVADLETLPACVSDTIKEIWNGVEGPGCIRSGTLRIEREEPEYADGAWWQGVRASAEFDITT